MSTPGTTLDFDPATVLGHHDEDQALEGIIESLTASQLRLCIEQETDGARRPHMLAMLTGQLIKARRPSPITMGELPRQHQSQITYALMLARAHVRYPLQGSALQELHDELNTALTALGLN